MTNPMRNIQQAITSGQVGPEDYAALPLPDFMRAVTTHRNEIDMFEGLDSWDKDPRKSLHVDEVALPQVGPNEALVAVMASSINFNTVWSTIFEPIPTFQFLKRAAKRSPWDQRHDLPYHILGSDAAGVILRVGPEVTLFKPGDEVTIHCNYVDMQAPDGHDDSMLDPDQRIWGFETNFGGLAEIALVRANQLMPKPPHLTWEEAASMPLVNSTSYDDLVAGLGIDTMVSPRAITVSTILRHVRRGRIRSVHSISHGVGEVIEAEALETSSLVAKPLREADLPEGVMIGAVLRGRQVIMPRGDTVISAGDLVVLYATTKAAKRVERLFSVKLEFF